MSRLFMPRYDARLQLMAFQIKMLRSRISDHHIHTTPEERAELLRLGALLDHGISDVMHVVKPATYKRWLNGKKEKRSKPGRPGTPRATVNLVLQFASENLMWGYKHIHGELRKLGIRIGETTVRDILNREGHYPVPEKGRRNPQSTWKQFISSHMDTLIACDFFTKPVYMLKGRIDAYVLVFIHLGSRRVFMSPATFYPTEEWVLQQARNATMWLQDLGIQATHLIHDRDAKFNPAFREFWKTEKIKCVKTPVRAPQANGYAEACIGVFKKKCLDHFICFSLDQLDYIKREWLAYYNFQRPHQGKEIGNKVLSGLPARERLNGSSAWAALYRGTIATPHIPRCASCKAGPAYSLAYASHCLRSRRTA